MKLGRKVSALTVGGAVVSAVLLGAAPAQAAPGDIYAVDTNNDLFTFSPASPGNVTKIGNISGLQDGEAIQGIDFRPADGLLYAITLDERIYTIDLNTAAATFRSTINIPLEGSNFGFDFNPVPDRLRVVSNSGQNLRINVDTGATTVDGRLNYADGTGDPNAGKTPNVTAVAYTNPDTNAATGTELFDIDAGGTQDDVISKQDPPNDGNLRTRGTTGQNSTQLVGFDFASDNTGYAGVIQGGNELFRVTLDDNDPATNGQIMASQIGPIGNESDPDDPGLLVDLAIQLADRGPTPVIPEAPYSALLLVGGAAVGATIIFKRHGATA